MPSKASPSPSELRTIILAMAAEKGFSRARIAAVPPTGPGSAAYAAMVRSKRTAELGWMADGISPRRHPRELLPEATSALVLGIDYHWDRPPDPGGLTGKVSRYAWGRDYHNLVSKRLRRMTRDLRKEGIDGYWSVDARPLIERAWAARAGLGFVGRNCMVMEPGRGSWFFLGVILLDAEATPDAPMVGGLARHCGRCTQCHDACPTAAFTGDGQLDAARCISTLTIEHRGVIPWPLARQMGRWVFGCDVCQEVCPHNHRPPTSLEADFAPRPGHAWLDLAWIMQTPDEELEAQLSGSPLRRPRAAGLKRNAVVVLENMGTSAAIREIERGLDHPHSVVVNQARQALDRLSR